MNGLDPLGSITWNQLAATTNSPGTSHFLFRRLILPLPSKTPTFFREEQGVV